MADPLDRLALWLQPFSITPNADALAERRRLVTGLATDDELTALPLMTTACGLDDGRIVSEAIGRIDGSVVVEGQQQLVATLATAAVAVRLDEVKNEDATLLALLAQSAGFLGLELAVPEVRFLADAALAGRARRVRHRAQPAEAVNEIRGLLRGANTSAIAADATAATINKAVTDRDRALRAVAQRVDSLVGWAEARIELLEEELDLLWWSRRGRSRDDQSWGELPPTQRAAVCAGELADLLARAPAPPSVRSLLREALGADADVETLIVDVAAAFVPVDNPRRHPLLPLTTYAVIAAELGIDEEDAVARMFGKVVELSGDGRRPLIESAEQVLRERHIAAML
jgi:hypothetical protein